MDNGNVDGDASPFSAGKELSPTDPASLHAEITQTRLELKKARRELRQEREQEALLAGELQHGVRNMLAVIRLVFSRSMAAGGPLDDIADHFLGRLDVLSRYQLTRTHRPGGSADFETMLLDELQSAQAADDPRVILKGRAAEIPYGAAQLVGLAIHELATNSIKFGVLSSNAAAARLSISWSVTPALLVVTWQETGVAVLAPAPVRMGFGWSFIEEALPYQLGASTSFDLAPGRLTCKMSIPLSDREKSRLMSF
jgi:two-component sensor histidine kinase